MAKRTTKATKPAPTTRDDGGKSQAVRQLASVREMVAALRRAQERESCEESARRTIEEDALSVQVRDGWRQPGTESEGAEEYAVLLCTGGPAVRIVGEIGQHDEPSTASIEYQDWFTPWTRLPITNEDEADLLAYVGCFYLGE